MTETTTQPRTLTIDVWSDIACPWCYIGSRRLNQAIEQARSDRPEAEIVVRYRAFLLDPHARPADGRTEVDVLALKFGDREAAQRMLADMTVLAASEGLQFDFDRLVPTTTKPAHQLLAYAAATHPEAQARVAQALFKAHFTEGKDVADPEVLAAVATESGMDPQAALAGIEDESSLTAVIKDLTRARDLGITGVPFYVFDGKYSAAGAQQVEVFSAAFQQVMQG